MADRADTHDAVPGLKMAPGVPRDGGDAVAELDAVAVQPLRDLQRAFVDFGVIGAVDGTFDRPCNDLLCPVDCRRVFENSVTKQRPVLHQPKHTDVPPKLYDRLPRFFCGIAVKFSAPNAPRKWPCRGRGGRDAAMVTVAAVLLMLCAQADPASAAGRSASGPRDDLFGAQVPKLRGSLLPAPVPLPKPRPAEAPAA